MNRYPTQDELDGMDREAIEAIDAEFLAAIPKETKYVWLDNDFHAAK